MNSKYRLSFADINIIDGQILEIIVDEGITISLEMSEELETFVSEVCKHPIGVLVNRINNYEISFEAKLSLLSSDKIIARASVVYSDEDKHLMQKFAQLRYMDKWVFKTFPGFEQGHQNATDWLNQHLETATCA